MDKLTLNFDESGNLGKDGRYFTIACIETNNFKPIKNVMKKSILKVKKEFPKYQSYKEIKAVHANPIIKDYLLRKIISKDVNIRYVVADLHHTDKELIKDENLLYNYLLHFLIKRAAQKQGVKQLIINIDKRTIRVGAENSFKDYIKIKLKYELGLDVEIDVNYFESHNSYAIQAADYVANTINAYYEYRNNEYLYGLIKDKVCQRELFPRRNFGKDKRKIVTYTKTIR